MILQKGSRGEDVTKLQQMLKDAGFFPKSQATTQFFGDITDKALKEYQKSIGQNSDGIYNPATKQNLTSAPETKAFHEQLIKAGNYQGASQYQQMMQSNPEDAIVVAKGFQAPTGLTPETIQGFKDMARQETERYYNELNAKSTADTDSFMKQSLQGYNDKTGQLQSQLGQDVNTLNDTEGQRGTWASSGRQDRLNSLQNTYNTSFKDLYNQTFSQMQDKSRDAEYQFGYKNPQTLNLIQANASQTQAPQFQSQSSTVYNPFNFYGRNQDQQNVAIGTRAKELAQGQMYNPFK